VPSADLTVPRSSGWYRVRVEGAIGTDRRTYDVRITALDSDASDRATIAYSNGDHTDVETRIALEVSSDSAETHDLLVAEYRLTAARGDSREKGFCPSGTAVSADFEDRSAAT
jgi:hypothetical protein